MEDLHAAVPRRNIARDAIIEQDATRALQANSPASTVANLKNRCMALKLVCAQLLERIPAGEQLARAASTLSQLTLIRLQLCGRWGYRSSQERD